MENIQTKIGRFYRNLNQGEEGGPHTRYKSWEWCHSAFLKYKEIYKSTNDENEKNKIIDYLSLHLGFYLASWGMYRGSTFLLQRDYKAHKRAVSIILNLGEEYDFIWDYNPVETNIKEARDLLFATNDGLYNLIEKSYMNQDVDSGMDKSDDKTPSDTLVTKILMGTLACVPAFDNFLKDGISIYKNAYDINGIKLCKNILNKNNTTFTELAKIVISHKDEFKVDNNLYPPMKCLDMYFWQIGYEKSIADIIKPTSKSKENKKIKFLQLAKDLKLCDESDNMEEAYNKIIEKNR